MSGSAPAATPGLRQVLARRTVISLAVVLICSVPYALFAILSGQWATASWTTMGAITGLIGLLLGGLRVGLLGTALLIVLTPLSIVLGGIPAAGTALMALMCVGVGFSARVGLHRGTLMLPVLMASLLIAPPSWSGHNVDRTTTSYLLWMTLFLGGGALWANLVFPRLLRKRPPSRAEPAARSDMIVYTLIITVLCTAATLGVLLWRPGSQGAWLVVTLLVVTEVGHHDTLSRAGRAGVRDGRRGSAGGDRCLADQLRGLAAGHRSDPGGHRGGSAARTALRAVHGLHDPIGRAVQLKQHCDRDKDRQGTAGLHPHRGRVGSPRLRHRCRVGALPTGQPQPSRRAARRCGVTAPQPRARAGPSPI